MSRQTGGRSSEGERIKAHIKAMMRKAILARKGKRSPTKPRLRIVKP